MRGSRDLCVTPLLLADVFLTRTDYIPSHWLRGQGYKTTTKNQKARGYVKKRPYASTHHQSRISPFSKNRRQWKQTVDASPIWCTTIWKSPLPQLCKLVPFFQLYRISFRRMILYTQKQRLSGEEGGGGEITTVIFCIKTTLIRDGSFLWFRLTDLSPPTTHTSKSLSESRKQWNSLGKSCMKAGRCGICIILTPLLRFFYHPRASLTPLHVKNETFVPQCSNYLFSWVNVCSMIFFPNNHSQKTRKQ